MNPFYDHFKVMIGEGAGSADDDNIGDVYRTILYQRGYGFHDDLTDYDNMYGLGFSDVMSNLFRLAQPLLRRGLQYLGNQAVSTAANIAHDAIAGENITDSAKKHMTNVASDVFAKAPAAIANAVMKNTGMKRGPRSSDRAVKREASFKPRQQQKRLKTNKVGRGLLKEYPALKKIV